MSNRLAYVLAAVTVAAAGGVLSGYRPVLVSAGLLLAFVLPGAALTAAMFADRRQLATTERILLVPALSLATLVLGGLAAWALGASLTRTSWLAISAGVTLAGLAVTLLRSARTVAEPVAVAEPVLVAADRDGVLAREPSRWDRPAIRRMTRELLPLVLVALVLGGASWLSLASSIRSHDVTVIALSAAPPSPTDVDGKRVVEVTATGLPADDSSYSVVVSGASGSSTTRRQVTTDGAGRWTASLSVPGGERVTVGLYRAGQAAADRTVIVAAG